MVLLVTKSSLLMYLNIYSTNYLALNNFSFLSFPKSDQTLVLQDNPERASAGQVFLTGLAHSPTGLILKVEKCENGSISVFSFFFLQKTKNENSA